jgi:surface protein
MDKTIKQPENLPIIKCYDYNIDDIVNEEIAKYGYNCSLNHLDLRAVTNTSCLFDGSKFNGDISQWDMRNVQNINFMFFCSKFNGDISKWNMRNVRTMQYTFAYSRFRGKIDYWDTSNLKYTNCMIIECPLEKNPPKWYHKENK